MKRFLKSALALTFCFGLIFSFACSKSENSPNVAADDIRLVSTTPADNDIVSIFTGNVSFVFDKAVYVNDKAKITLNGAAVVDASIDGTTLTATIRGLLKSSTKYTLTVDKGAVKDASDNLNKEVFSLKFATEDDPVIGGSVTQNGFLSVKGVSLVNKDGKGLVLHGVSLGWHNWWPRFYNENTIAWLKSDWKCDYIRVPIGVEPDGAYLSDPDFALSCLYTVVDAAIKNDMYVIADWHIDGSDPHEADALIFFQTVAEKYKDYPNIIYEVFNEPNNAIAWSSVKSYAENVIETIRNIDTKNVIIVGSPFWDQNIDKAAADPIKGYDNLMYTLHFYAGSSGQSVRDLATEALFSGLPLFVTECGGMDGSGDGAINTAEWQKWIQWMDDNHISWDAWDIADKNESCSMIKDGNSPVSGWKDSDLKTWGQIVRTQLRSYH